MSENLEGFGIDVVVSGFVECCFNCPIASDLLVVEIIIARAKIVVLDLLSFNFFVCDFLFVPLIRCAKDFVTQFGKI